VTQKYKVKEEWTASLLDRSQTQQIDIGTLGKVIRHVKRGRVRCNPNKNFALFRSSPSKAELGKSLWRLTNKKPRGAEGGYDFSFLGSSSKHESRTTFQTCSRISAEKMKEASVQPSIERTLGHWPVTGEDEDYAKKVEIEKKKRRKNFQALQEHVSDRAVRGKQREHISVCIVFLPCSF